MIHPIRRRGFTLLELLVVIVIIAVLVAFLFPFVGRMAARGRTSTCSNFMRQIGAAVIAYATDNDGNLPVTTHQRRAGGKSWSVTLQRYASGTLCFRCPCDEDSERPYSYVINDFLTPNPAGAPDLDLARLSRLENAREIMLFGEASKEYLNADHFHFSDYAGHSVPPEVFQQQIAVQRHLGEANYLFADAHVETLPWERVRRMLGEPGNRLIDPTVTSPTP
jgi:prepilin-type N-terminal cleavage/methylation domain-containing protein/prepilin-type processing-associated H-X9-DG protein